MSRLGNNMKGFNNIGNTCYLNSGLQLLINNKDLCQEIVNTSNSELSNFIKEYYNNNTNNTLTPRFIKEIVEQKNNQFRGFGQNDSFEFIIYFLEYILSIIKSNPYEIKSTTRIKCKLLNCLNIINTDEKNNFLLLDIDEDKNDLDDLYRKYKSREKIDYKCSKCNKNVFASKLINITRWPKDLIIVLKRFNYNGRGQKISSEIEIPLSWRHNYKLNGLVFHSGNVSGGHYIYIGLTNNRWLIYNDDSVKEITEAQLNNYKNNGYIYYFSQN